MTKRIYARATDAMLTTTNRLTAEPAPPAPNFGVRRDGTPGPAPDQAEVDTAKIAASIIKGLGLLSASDLAAVKAALARHFSSGPTSRVGITSSDTATDAVMEAHAAVEHVRAGCDRVASINKANADFWSRRAADESRLVGRYY
jgi:hypothetical protein